MNFVTSISLVVLGAMFLALLGWGSIRAAWRNCEGRRGVFAALAILAAVCSIVAQKPSPDTPTITVDALLRDVGCYATNNVFHAAVTNAPSYAGVDFSDSDLMVYARERASTNAASWFELTPRKKFSQQPADYAIANATNYNYLVYLDYVPPSPVHTNGVFELHGFVIPGYEPGNLEQLAAGFINSRAEPPPYDAEVEYLQSSGTQYINTGAYSGSITGIACRVKCNSFATYKPLFGVYNSEQHDALRLILQGQSNGQGWITANRRAQGSISMSFALNSWHDILIDCSNNSCVVDGVSYTSNTPHGTALSIPLVLFGQNTRGSISASSDVCIANFKIYTSAGSVYDLIAVRKDGVGYMYDRVSGQLFGNNGMGAFRVGPDK